MAVIKYKDSEGYWRRLNEGTKVIVDTELSTSSTNPIQNKPVAEAIQQLDGNKQDRLISGTNIRQINGQNLLDPDLLDTDIVIPPGSKTYVLHSLSFTDDNITSDRLSAHSTNYKDTHKEAYDSVISTETSGYAMEFEDGTYVVLNNIIKNEDDSITFTSVILTDDNQIVTINLTLNEDGSIKNDVTTRTTYITDETIERFLVTKQDVLVDSIRKNDDPNFSNANINIKTIGGQSILGEGNIPVTASIESGKDIKKLEDTKGEYDIVGEGSILLKTLTVNGEEHSLIGDENNKTITIVGGGGDGDYTDLMGLIALKQDKLIDTTNVEGAQLPNIKTINGESIFITNENDTNIDIYAGEVGPTEPSVIFREILAEGDALPSDAKEDDTYASYNIETIRLTSEGKALPVMDGVLPLMHSIDDYDNMIAIFETVTYELGDLMGSIGGALPIVASAADDTATVDDTGASSSLTEAAAPGAVGMKSAVIIEVGSDGALTVPDNSGLLGANVLLPKSIDPSLPTFNLDVFGVDESMLEGLGGDIAECIAEVCNELSTSPVEPDTDTYEIVYGVDGANPDVLAEISPQWFKDNDGGQYNGWYDTEDGAAAAGTIVNTAWADYDSTVDEATGEVKGWSDWEFSGGYTPSTASTDDEYATSTADDSSSSSSLGLDKMMLISPSLYTYYNHISYGSCIGMMKGSIMDIGYPTAYVNPLHTFFNLYSKFPTVLQDAMYGNIPSFDPVTMIDPNVLPYLCPNYNEDDPISYEKAEYYYTKAIEIVKFFMSDNGPLGGLMSGGLAGLDSISTFMGMFFSSSIVQHVQFGEDTTGMSAESYFPWALDVQYSFAGATFIRHYILDVQSLTEGEKGYTMFFDELLDTASAGGSGGSVEASAEIYIGSDNEDLNASGAVIWINPDGEPAGETPGSSIVVIDDNMTGIATAASGVTYIKNFPSDATDKSFIVRSYGKANTNLSHYTFHLKGASSIELPAGTLWANGLIPEALDPNCIYEIDVYGTRFVSTYYYKATYAVFPLQ